MNFLSLCQRWCAIVLLGWFAAGTMAWAVEEPAPAKDADAKPPKLVIRGLGLLDNRKLNRMIQQTYPDEARDRPFDANLIEDAFVILRNQLQMDGFQEAIVRAELTLVDGGVIQLEWDGRSELDVPRPMSVQEARFRAEEGPLFHYRSFTISGLHAMTFEEATGFFFKTDMLLRLNRNRRFSRQQLQRSMANLRQELINLGYRNATVEAADLQQDLETGEVDVHIAVNEGRLHRVTAAHVRIEGEETVLEINEPWSPHWQQDFTADLRNQQYLLGRPDARARVEEVTTNVLENVVLVELKAVVEPGEQVSLGGVRFEGQERTRAWWLRDKGRVKGPLLDRLEVDRARERLARQGIFDFVGIRYEPAQGPTRDVVFDLDEGRRVDFSLLAGYGSYDQFFGGAELDNYNLWGIGHSSRLRGMLSTKTANVIYTYSIPEFLAQNLSLYGNVDALLREELTFERQEIKTAIGLRKVFPVTRFQMGLRYSYQFLKTQDSPDPVTNDEFTRVAAIILDGQLERRDNPLAPRKGYRLYGNVEVANPALGSQADYQLFLVGASGHVPIRRGLIVHGGVQHGAVFSPDPAVDLPFNKRFLTGGDNSVRGFRRGGASPYNDQGQQIGAEVFLQWNVELEQYLTERWSIVGFVDGVGNSPVVADYPFRDVLWSVGGGIRWNSIIGPVRAEYGYNLNPRSFDPTGTLHIAIGFPF